MGGMSHVDSFDYKPGLAKLHGKELQYEEPTGDLLQQNWLDS